MRRPVVQSPGTLALATSIAHGALRGSKVFFARWRRAVSRRPNSKRPRQDQTHPRAAHRPRLEGAAHVDQARRPSLSDVLGLGRFTADAAHGLTGLVEHMLCSSSTRRDWPGSPNP